MAGELVLRALKHVWLTLERLNLPMAVMGGIACAVWGRVRATQDVDLLVGIEKTDPDQLLRQLAGAKVRPKLQPPILTLGQLRIVQLLYEPPDTFMDLQIDLLLAESDYHREALARRVPTRLPALDLDVLVLTCEDMILHKLLAGRILDRADAAALLRLNRASLDLAYLLRWTDTLGLGPGLAEVWSEAFPEETPPAAEAPA
jgi:hypothetical protein